MVRVKVVLACEQCGTRNYITSKDGAKRPERIEQRKFCRSCNAHTKHQETR